MKYRLSSLILTLLLPCVSLPALQITEGAFRNDHVFGIQFLQDNQEFYGVANRINSVSLQEYVTSTFHVTEMVIDITGSSLQLRIYHTGIFDPRKVAQRTAQLQAQSGVSSVNMGAVTGWADKALPGPGEQLKETADAATNILLTKDYPVTTHARTLEYRVSSREELVHLYKAVRDRWIRADPKSMDENYTDEQKAASENAPNKLHGTLFIVE